MDSNQLERMVEEEDEDEMVVEDETGWVSVLRSSLCTWKDMWRKLEICGTTWRS